MSVSAQSVSGLSPLYCIRGTPHLPLAAVITAHLAPVFVALVSALTLNSGIWQGTLLQLESPLFVTETV